MKKKILPIAIATTIILSPFGRITQASERQPVRNEVEVTGFIGPDGNDFDHEHLININMPHSISWLVSNEPGYIGQVRSPEFSIENHSRNANLSVTLISFIQNTGPSIPGLTLNLTGHLFEAPIGENIVGFTEGETPFTNILLSELGYQFHPEIGYPEFTYGFDGRFTGSIPVEALTPTYTMVLEFSVHSFSTDAQNNN